MDPSLEMPLPRRQRLSLPGRLSRLFRAIGQCRERARTRHLLAQFNDQQLSDIGISHSERMAELERPFWQ